MKTTKSRLQEIIKEELSEYADGAGSVGSRGVAGSHGATGMVDTGGLADETMEVHADSIASSYGTSDPETIKRIALVLSTMMKSDQEFEVADVVSMLTDMLYHLVDKSDHEESPLDEETTEARNVQTLIKDLGTFQKKKQDQRALKYLETVTDEEMAELDKYYPAFVDEYIDNHLLLTVKKYVQPDGSLSENKKHKKLSVRIKKK